MSGQPVAIARPTEYVVNCLPETDMNASTVEITVAYRGRDLWAVKRRSFCLSTSGEWDYEFIPSGREDDWLAEHRFPLERALELAKAAAVEALDAAAARVVAGQDGAP